MKTIKMLKFLLTNSKKLIFFTLNKIIKLIRYCKKIIKPKVRILIKNPVNNESKSTLL